METLVRKRTKIVSIGIAALIGLLMVGYLSLLRADIPAADLESKYGTSESRFVELDRARVHYRDHGDPSHPTLLLIHGFGASLETWELWVRNLQSHYRVVTVDLPGHGL